MPNLDHNESRKVAAQLDNGQIVFIDNCSKKRDIKYPERYDYLGMGVHCYKVDGEKQLGKERYHFFKLKEPHR